MHRDGLDRLGEKPEYHYYYYFLKERVEYKRSGSGARWWIYVHAGRTTEYPLDIQRYTCNEIKYPFVHNIGGVSPPISSNDA